MSNYRTLVREQISIVKAAFWTGVVQGMRTYVNCPEQDRDDLVRRINDQALRVVQNMPQDLDGGN